MNPKSLEAKLKVELHDWLASHVPDMEPGEKQLWQQQTLHLIPGGAGVAAMRDQYQDGLKLLLIAAGCVLLVACANLANLMLARGLKDRAQTSIRVALGASRGRLVRKALVESVLLAVIGGVLGIGVAYAGTRLILYLAFQIGGPNNYVPIDATPSWPVLLFTLGISVLTGVIFGIAPAWMTSHADPVEALRGANRSVGGGRSWAQKSLVIAQAAMSLVLLSAAALLGQSLRNLEHQNFGFETAGPVHRLDQSHAEQLQAGATGAHVPANRRSPAPDSRCADGGASALCAHDGRQLERRHSHPGQAGARG